MLMIVSAYKVEVGSLLVSGDIQVSALAEEVQGKVSWPRPLEQVTSKLSTSFQCSSVTQSCPPGHSLWPHGLQHTRPLCPSPTPGVYSNLMSIESVMPSNHLILCHPLLLPPSIFPIIRAFSGKLVLCIRWPKYCSFSFSISPLNEHSGLISFRMDWLDLLVVQGTLKNLRQHHSSKASILQCSSSLIWNIHP